MTKITTDEYFGGCPECGDQDGWQNVGRSHWGYCIAHRNKWCIGANLFSSWRDETEAEQRARYNTIGLGDFTEVESVHPDITKCPRCNAMTIHYRTALETHPHHPLCRKPGTDEPSPLPDDAVRAAIEHLDGIGYRVEAVHKEDAVIPF